MELVKEDRRLVNIRKVNAVNPIPGADAIEVATVDSWEVVIKKGEFVEGDYCVFFEIDSFLPAADPRFAFLARNGTKMDEANVERIRLKTIRLRKQLSQGLALSTAIFEKEIEEIFSTTGETLETLEDNRYGIQQFLNVTKYERPEDRSSNGGAGRAKTAGDFPHFVRKTDADRLQNCYNKLKDKMRHVAFRPTLKLEGSSTTIAFVSDENLYFQKLDDIKYEYNPETQELEEVGRIPYPFSDENGQVIVCSRNLALKYDESSAFWKGVHNTQMHVKLREYCEMYSRQLAIQCELLGPGVQGNYENLEEHTLYAFHIWDIDNQCYLDDAEFYDICNHMQVQTAPVFPVEAVFLKYSTFDEFLTASRIPSINNPVAEGIVYKSTTKVNGQTVMFKVINTQYLENEK